MEAMNSDLVREAEIIEQLNLEDIVSKSKR